MQKYRLKSWCESATCMIRFKPDQKSVYNELMGHLEERRDAYMEQGLDEKEATTKTLDAMGSPYKIASQLAAIHRPFWGYYLRVVKILLIILLVLSLKTILDYAKDLRFYNKSDGSSFDFFDAASYGGNSGMTLLSLSQPGTSFSSDGNTFTLTDVAVYTAYSKNYEEDRTYLHILIRQESPLPWTEHDEYFNYHAITGWFFARDNLGNTYKGYMEPKTPDAPVLKSYSVQSGLFSCTHRCWINDFPPEAAWVEICYERDGRSYALRVDLTGGGAN